MPTLDEADPSIQFVMFTGEPGLRKSTHAMTYPGPQYWFSWDQKMQALKVPQKLWDIDPKTIHYDDYKDWSTAEAKLKEFQVKPVYKGQRIQTIVFDSVTTLADAILRQSLTRTRNEGAKVNKVGNIIINDIEDYNAETAAFNTLLALSKDIHVYHKVNIILIAHVMEVSHKKINGDTTLSRTIVTAAKRVAAKLPAICTEVYHFHIKAGFDASKGGDYAIFTEHTGDDFARTALNLPKQIILGDKPLYGEFIKPAIDKLKG